METKKKKCTGCDHFVKIDEGAYECWLDREVPFEIDEPFDERFCEYFVKKPDDEPEKKMDDKE